MFMGEYHPSLDEKGRVAVPIKLRKAFGEDVIIEKLVVTYGFGKYIMAYRVEDWDDFVKTKLIKASETDPDGPNLVRYFVGGAFECELDKQGRIIVPQHLKEHAGIAKDVTVLGLYNRIEIWDTAMYNSNKPSGETLSTLGRDLGF
ncbi:MAG TPA: division/cell wall cluster transcriptional repressor MraZ [Spirochaetota bacterium]|nr:division/cell wall cluster transcriptional repressor MraZ [Spirochaetota bacterium]HPJ39224.1 division/cell wall cluster transcriptional repressor MraZ [Spirochaetota bacterium]